MPVLTYAEIDTTCQKIRDNIILKYPRYSSHIKLMYLYGCRINEVFDYRISFNASSGNVEINPQKGNNLRVLPMVNSEVPVLIEELNITQDNFWLNKRNLQRIIDEVHPIRNLKCGDKNIGAHLFRHNWIRKQVENGKQYTEIDNLLGYTSQSVRDTYLAATIYY